MGTQLRCASNMFIPPWNSRMHQLQWNSQGTLHFLDFILFTLQLYWEGKLKAGQIWSPSEPWAQRRSDAQVHTTGKQWSETLSLPPRNSAPSQVEWEESGLCLFHLLFNPLLGTRSSYIMALWALDWQLHRFFSPPNCSLLSLPCTFLGKMWLLWGELQQPIL